MHRKHLHPKSAARAIIKHDIVRTAAAVFFGVAAWEITVCLLMWLTL
jgi:hypothetical protein